MIPTPRTEMCMKKTLPRALRTVPNAMLANVVKCYANAVRCCTDTVEKIMSANITHMSNIVSKWFDNA